MEVVHGWGQPHEEVGTILAIGVFDGVHLGHQSLIRGAVERARLSGTRSSILTFHPHPRSVTAPHSLWGYLCSLEERIARIAELGPDRMMILPFTPELAATPAEEFIQELLHRVPLQELHVGANFSLGQGGRGKVALLRLLGQQWGFAVRSIPQVCLDGQAISSTRIRQLIQSGQVWEAARSLGRPFSLRGPVIAGAGQGVQLGFPTANLYLHPRQILPADGVYAAWVRLPAVMACPALLPGLTYVGRRPTFGSGDRGVEVHLFDFCEDLRGRELRAEFVQRLRPERTFATAEELVAQMHRDAAQARSLLESSA